MVADVMEELRQLRTMANNEILIDSVEPTWMGRRLYYFIKQDAYYAYDHRWGYRYFGRYPNDADAKARIKAAHDKRREELENDPDADIPL